jgi:hypothetical protein
VDLHLKHVIRGRITPLEPATGPVLWMKVMPNSLEDGVTGGVPVVLVPVPVVPGLTTPPTRGFGRLGIEDGACRSKGGCRPRLDQWGTDPCPWSIGSQDRPMEAVTSWVSPFEKSNGKTAALGIFE